MNVYPVARTAALTGGLDVSTDPLSLVLVGAAFAYDPTDTHLADIAGTLAPAVVVTVTGVVDGEASADPVTFAAVADGLTITGLLLYRSSDSMLVALVDRRADSVPLSPTAGNGGDLTFTFVDYLLKI